MGDLVLLVLFYVINSPKYILRDFKTQIKKIFMDILLYGVAWHHAVLLLQSYHKMIFI